MKKKLKTEVYDYYALKKCFKIMRNFFFIMFLSIGQLLALESYSQRTTISLDFHQSKLVQVLDAIESQSNYFFLFNGKLIDVNRKVNIQAEEQEITKILDRLFEGTNIDFQIIDRKIVLSPNHETSFQQSGNAPVKGHVKDSKGQPLPGVTIVIKGTNRGTVTGVDGDYSMADVPGDATLVFSFVGMKSQEIFVGGKSSIDLILEDETIGIEEVVAIGYGTMKKSDLTGAVVSADIESFRETSNKNIIQSLQGSVPGLNVGMTNSVQDNPSFSIRGKVTISGSSTPLIVLDGVIYRGDLVDINPNDVKSVDILKDASATAIYGSQAANGVIIITTNQGGKRDKPVFQYSASYSSLSPAFMPTPLDREGYIDKVSTVYWDQAFLAPDYIQPNPDFNVLSKLNYSHLQSGYTNGTDINSLDLNTRNGGIVNHNISMSTKTKNTSYHISLGYNDSKGYIKNDNYKRYSVRMNVENNITDWLKIGTQSFLTSSNYSGESLDMYQVIKHPPLTELFNEDGSLITFPDGSSLNNLLVTELDDFDKRLNMFGVFYCQIDIPWIKGLNYKISHSSQYTANRHYYFNPYVDSDGLIGNGYGYKQHSEQYDWSLDNLLTYSRNFNDIHGVNIMFGAGREERSNNSTSASSADLTTLNLSWNSLESGSIDKQRTSSGAWNESSLYYVGRIFYSLFNKYLFTGTLRKDGFSGFSENNKTAVFPSAAIGWKFSEEKFVKNNLNWLDYGKLRISYGKSGNRTGGRYQTLAKMSMGYSYVYGDNGPASSAVSLTTTSLANKNLKWETSSSLNFGLDFGVVNSRVSGSVEYYRYSTKDLLYNVSLPEIGGISSSLTNVGEIANEGIEVALNSINIKRNGFLWESSVVFSRNRNKVVSIFGIDNDGDGKEDDLVASGLFIGEPLDVWYNYNIIGIYQIGDTDIPSNSAPGLYREEDLNNDGVISPAEDKKIIGYKDPSYRVSLRNKISYKNFSLMFFLNSIQGGKNYYYGKNRISRTGENAVTMNTVKEAIENIWSPTNPDALFQTMREGDQQIDSRYFQRSFVRLQDVILSYTLPDRFLSKYNIEGLKLFVSGKNLATWSNWIGYDPEIGSTYYDGQMPVLKDYTFGISFSF